MQDKNNMVISKIIIKKNIFKLIFVNNENFFIEIRMKIPSQIIYIMRKIRDKFLLHHEYSFVIENL